MNFRRIYKTVGRWCVKNSTKLLAAGAIISEAIGFYFMHKEAPIVKERLDALPEDAKWMEKVKAAGPVYLPAFGMLLLSCGCIVGGCAVGEHKAAIAASLYSASEAALRKLEDNMIKELGPEQAQKVHDAVAKEVIAEQPITENTTIYETGRGTDIIYDPLTGQTFYSSPTAIIEAMNRINHEIQCGTDQWADVNEWLFEIGLKNVGLGGFAGWNITHLIDISTDPEVWPHMTINGHSAFVIPYHNRPVLYK